MHMYQDHELDLLCVGDYIKGTESYFDKSFGNYLPGEPEDVLNFKIYLTKMDKENKEQLLDVTDWISDKEKDRLITNFMEHCREMSLEREYTND